MKKSMITGISILLVLGFSIPAAAVPRLQTYIVDSQYRFLSPQRDYFTWVTNSQSFDLKVVGYWGESGTDVYSAGCRRTPSGMPSYDFMDCYLAMSVPKYQSGRIYINGVEISSFQRWCNALPAGLHPSWTLAGTQPARGNRFNIMNIGRVDNDQVNAYHYGFGHIGKPGWGDEILLDVVVRGFDWAHFDAIGVDASGNTFTNSPCYDSSYHATPEPSTLSLLSIGLLGIAPLLRKRRK